AGTVIMMEGSDRKEWPARLAAMSRMTATGWVIGLTLGLVWLTAGPALVGGGLSSMRALFLIGAILAFAAGGVVQLETRESAVRVDRHELHLVDTHPRVEREWRRSRGLPSCSPATREWGRPGPWSTSPAPRSSPVRHRRADGPAPSGPSTRSKDSDRSAAPSLAAPSPASSATDPRSRGPSSSSSPVPRSSGRRGWPTPDALRKGLMKPPFPWEGGRPWTC